MWTYIFATLLIVSVTWPVLVAIGARIFRAQIERADARRWAATRARVQAKSEEMMRRGQL